MKSGDPLATEQLRVVAIRKLYARGTTKQFAESIGLTGSQWSNFECHGKFSRMAAEKLHAYFPDISIDWIWWGSTRGMTQALLSELREAAAKK